eukprot:COSAG05_NODE_474_length_9484_cov_8.277784_7_plen_124_part_00
MLLPRQLQRLLSCTIFVLNAPCKSAQIPRGGRVRKCMARGERYLELLSLAVHLLLDSSAALQPQRLHTRVRTSECERGNEIESVREARREVSIRRGCSLQGRAQGGALSVCLSVRVSLICFSP